MNLCVAIVGPTASGKTQFALEVAKVVGGEIVCLDSTTVYKGFDIGTAKPDAECQKQVPHHLLDIIEPPQEFHAMEFIERADRVLSDIHSRGRLPIVVGGTFFYLKALQFGMYAVEKVPEEVVEAIEKEFFEDEDLQSTKMHEALQAADPASAARIHPNDRYRLVRALSIFRHTGRKPSELKTEPISDAQKSRHWLKYSMVVPRHKLSTQIVARTARMIGEGLIEETQKIREKYPHARALGSIGYAEVCRFLDGKIQSEKDLKNEIIEKTRQLAKRQICWARSDAEMRYIDERDLSRVKLEIDNLKFAMSASHG